jgi:hypothetical protein
MGQRLFTPLAVRVAAQIATVVFAIVSLLQLLLAAGVLPISMAWGGTQAVLTVALRLASMAAVGILVLFALVIRRRAGLSGHGPPSLAIKILSWVVTAYMALNVLGNLTSKSRAETLLFGPLSVVLLVSCLVVSISKWAE